MKYHLDVCLLANVADVEQQSFNGVTGYTVSNGQLHIKWSEG